MTNIHSRSSGLYRFELLKVSDHDEPIESTAKTVAEFCNVITDIGLVRMGGNSDYLNTCAVGDGSRPALPTDTSLQSFIARATVTDQASGARAEAPFFAWTQRTFTFARGDFDASRPVREVAIGWGTAAEGQIFSRALVTDAGGNPVAVTVLPDEVLRVTYIHRYYPPLVDEEFTLDITGALGGNYSVLARAAMVSTATYWVADAAQTNGTRQLLTAYDGDIGGITEQPSGNRVTMTGSPGTADGTSAAFALAAENPDLNLAGGIRSILLTMGNGAYQFQFTPPIPKDAGSSLFLQFSHSWGRL